MVGVYFKLVSMSLDHPHRPRCKRQTGRAEKVGKLNCLLSGIPSLKVRVVNDAVHFFANATKVTFKTLFLMLTHYDLITNFMLQTSLVVIH